jgi:hypothetical protein
MAAGRLRRTHPVFAIQLLAGPIVTHEMTRPLGALVDYNPSREEFVAEVVDSWMRAMAPDANRSEPEVEHAGPA